MLALAVVPCPPALVPALAAVSAQLLAPLLAACDAVVAGVVAARPSRILLIGPGRRTSRREDAETGTLAGFGVPPDRPTMDSALTYDDAPFGVYYLVAQWRPNS